MSRSFRNSFALTFHTTWVLPFCLSDAQISADVRVSAFFFTSFKRFFGIRFLWQPKNVNEKQEQRIFNDCGTHDGVPVNYFFEVKLWICVSHVFCRILYGELCVCVCVSIPRPSFEWKKIFSNHKKGRKSKAATGWMPSHFKRTEHHRKAIPYGIELNLSVLGKTG